MQPIIKAAWVSQESQSFGQHWKFHGSKDSLPQSPSGSPSKRKGWQILASLLWIPILLIYINSSQVDSICKNCPNLFWKNLYTRFWICVENYLRMFPEEFIYSPLYNHKEITSDLNPVLQPLCNNLMIVDIIDVK